MKLANEIQEALSKNDAKIQAKQLMQFLSKQKLKKGSKEEEKEIEKWMDSKDIDDKDGERIMKMLGDK